MKLAGLQKLTLLDFPGIMAAVVFTAGCNFRCPFCHNASLVEGSNDDFLSTDEVLKFLKLRQGILEGVVITGGEPLLHKDIDTFIKEIKNLGYKVKVDTNGTNPTLLKRLVEQKLVDYVAMDIKHSPLEYEKAVGTNNFSMTAVEESKEFLLSDKIDYEFRTTIVKGIHTKEGIINLAKWIEGAKRYYLQHYKASDGVLAPTGLDAFSKDEMEEILSEVSHFVKKSEIRGI